MIQSESELMQEQIELYIEKRTPVEAVKVTENNIEDVLLWCNGYVISSGDIFVLPTLYNKTIFTFGDFIVRNFWGEFSAYTQKTFSEIYRKDN